MKKKIFTLTLSLLFLTGCENYSGDVPTPVENISSGSDSIQHDNEENTEGSNENLNNCDDSVDIEQYNSVFSTLSSDENKGRFDCEWCDLSFTSNEFIDYDIGIPIPDTKIITSLEEYNSFKTNFFSLKDKYTSSIENNSFPEIDFATQNIAITMYGDKNSAIHFEYTLSSVTVKNNNAYQVINIDSSVRFPS